jgi:hypothetical protein
MWGVIWKKKTRMLVKFVYKNIYSVHSFIQIR